MPRKVKSVRGHRRKGRSKSPKNKHVETSTPLSESGEWSESGEISIPELSPNIYSNMYVELRIDPTLITAPQCTKSPKWCTRQVLVKRASVREKLAARTRRKRLRTMGWGDHPTVYANTTSNCLSGKEAVRQEQPPDWQTLKVTRGINGQHNALETWGNVLLYRQGLKEKLAHRLARPTRSLAMSQHRVPPIEQHQALCSYSESQTDFPCPQRIIERSYNGTSFFTIPDRAGPFDNELVRQLKWTERQFYKPPLSIVRPALDGNHLVPEHDNVVVETSLDRMYITGRRLDNAWPPAGDAGDQGVNEGEGRGQGKGAMSSRPSRVSPGSEAFKSPSTCTTDVTIADEEEESNTDDQATQAVTASPDKYDKPCLQVAHMVYAWNEPCSHEVIEVGLVTAVDSEAEACFKIANLGSTVIRYGWHKKSHTDHFRKGRYAMPRILFDQSDKILLPQETVTLQVKFKADHPGNWCERWYLTTIPRLGPTGHANIRVNFWGMALEIDHNYLARQRLDKHLEDLACRKTASHVTEDLLKFLPIRSSTVHLEPATVAWERSIVTPDERQFELTNPGLYCHSWALFMLAEVKWMLTRDHAAINVEQEAHPETEASKSKQDILASTTGVSVQHAARKGPSTVHGPAQGTVQKAASPLKETPDDLHPTTSITSTTSTTIKAVRSFLAEHSMKKADFHVAELHREVCGQEDCERKEYMLAKVNKAASDMTCKPQQSAGWPLKQLVFRLALASCVDQLSQVEWAIRQRILNPVTKISWHGSQTVELPRERALQSVSDNPTPNTKLPAQASAPRSQRNSLHSLRSCDKDLPLTSTSATYTSSAEDMIQSLEQYRVKLYTAIYQRLGSLMESMQPLMNHDGMALNPLLALWDT
ncbi:hypothetical protein BaRGS_00024792 [Batillaria attramentaria]|uniref:MYCBP-associated protein n=1 Tax=Batillaria attramentaria TaxID=370345 RepID=A0ABD0KA11_9CAEN